MIEKAELRSEKLTEISQTPWYVLVQSLDTVEKAQLVLQNHSCWCFLKTEDNYLPCSESVIPFSHFSALEGISLRVAMMPIFEYVLLIGEIGTASQSSDQM